MKKEITIEEFRKRLRKQGWSPSKQDTLHPQWTLGNIVCRLTNPNFHNKKYIAYFSPKQKFQNFVKLRIKNLDIIFTLEDSNLSQKEYIMLIKIMGEVEKLRECDPNA